MLPPVHDKKGLGVILASKMAEEAPDEEMDIAEGDDLADFAQDLIDAVHANDTEGVKAALRGAFEVMEMEPHQEAESTESE